MAPRTLLVQLGARVARPDVCRLYSLLTPPSSSATSPASLASVCRVVLSVLQLRMQVVSGIAVSLDGKSSWYIPLPPLLPPRPCEWHHLAHLPDEAPDGSSAAGRVNSGRGASPQNAGGGDAPVGEGHGQRGAEKETTRRPSSWGALPARAIERVSTLVSDANYGAMFLQFLPFK